MTKGMTRRTTTVAIVVALRVALSTSVAVARTFTCSANPCLGTNNADQITEKLVSTTS